MDWNEHDNTVGRPRKERRKSRNHDSVQSYVSVEDLPEDEEEDFNHGILETLLGGAPSSIRLYGGRQESYPHALKCFHNMLTALRGQPTMKETLEKLDVCHWREIHGFVLLQLGNISFKSCSEVDQHVSSEATIKLCDCLREIYKWSFRLHPYANGELRVAFEVVVDHTSDIVSIAGKTKELVLDPTMAEGIFRLVDLLSMLLQQRQMPEKASEKLSALLVRLLCDFSLDRESTGYQRAHGTLQDLANVPSKEVATAALMSQSIVTNMHQGTSSESNGNINEPLSSASESPRETLLYWRCLAHSRRGATRLSQNLDFLACLVRWALPASMGSAAINEDFKCSAAETLALTAINREAKPSLCSKDNVDPPQQDWTMDALIKVLVGATELSVKRRTIRGLQCCRPDQIPWQNTSYLPNVLSSLFLVANSNSDTPAGYGQEDSTLGAAQILLEIIGPILADHAGDNAPLSCDDAMSYVGRFLQMDTDPVLQHLAVTALARATQRSGSLLALCSPNVLNDLGTLSSNIDASPSLKLAAMEIFNTFTRVETNALSILARQPKVLTALVATVTGPGSDHAHNLKQIALVVLMRLSQEVCNRRLLAKHVGVLACMIRYARSLSAEPQPLPNIPQASTPEVSLSDLKRKISELASAI